ITAFVFFFASRRRHTISKRDWSSDVCSSDLGVKEIVNPEPYTVGSLTDTFEKYPHIDTVLPAMGYGEQQLKDLEETINKADCDAVIIGTPMDLTRIINIEK